MQNLKIKMDNEMKQINQRRLFERWKVIEDYDNYSVFCSAGYEMIILGSS